MFDLTGKVAVVTGASRGLGREDALTLARVGADVVITDVLIEDDPDLETTAQGSNSVLQDVARQQGWVYSNQTAEEIRKLGRERICQFHFKDKGYLGEGKVDFPAILAAIRAIGFEGWANLETGSPSGDADADTRRNLKYLEALMRG